MSTAAMWAGVLAVCCGLCWGARAAEENPFKNAKVGDWVIHTRTDTMGANKRVGTMKSTIKAKDEKNVTVTFEAFQGQTRAFANEMKISLEEPYEYWAAMMPGSKMEKLAEGAEKLTLGGKTYDCQWIESKVTLNMGGKKIESHNKVWTCKDVPCAGVVKAESRMGEKDEKFVTISELGECGRAP